MLIRVYSVVLLGSFLVIDISDQYQTIRTQITTLSPFSLLISSSSGHFPFNYILIH
jgi:hypothetical protein